MRTHTLTFFLLGSLTMFSLQLQAGGEAKYKTYFGRVVSAELVPHEKPGYILYKVILNDKRQMSLCAVANVRVGNPVFFRVNSKKWTAKCGGGGYQIPFDSAASYLAEGYDSEEINHIAYKMPSSIAYVLRCKAENQISVIADARIPGSAPQPKWLNYLGPFGGVDGVYILDKNLTECLP